MDTNKKLFAFKLAETRAKSAEADSKLWKAREGLSIAGCSLVDAYDNYRTQKICCAVPQYNDLGPYC